MNFLSSLFGYSDRPQQGSKISYIPPELKKYVEQVLGDTQALYEQRMGEGYTPYTGQTIAGFTPEQLQSQEGLKALVGSQRPYQDEALGIMRGGAEQFTADTAKKYMSPYQRAVIDEEKEQAQRQYERTQVPQFEKDAVAAGGMSGLGSRAGVEAAERATGQQRLLAGIETKGLQKAYEDAQEQFKSQKERERLLAGDIAQTGQNIFSAGLAEQGLLQGIGEEKRGMQQAGLDEALYKWQQQQQFPESQLARYMSSIYGNPMLSQPNYTTTKTPAQASMGKSLLGLGLAGYQAGGGFSKGGFSPSNWFKPKAGGGQVGGLSTLYRQTGSQVGMPRYSQYTGDRIYEDEQNVPDFIEGAGDEGVPMSQVAKLKADRDAQAAKLKADRDAQAAKLKADRDAQADESKPKRKSVAELTAEIRGTKSDALLAGLGEYLKPFGTPADIPGAMAKADRKAQIDAAKEELKMTSEEEKALAKVKAAVAKARGKKYSASQVLATWKDMAASSGLFTLGEDGKVLNLKGVLVSDDPKKAAQTRDKINKLLVEAYRKGESTGLQSEASEVMRKGMAEIIGVKPNIRILNNVTYIKDSTTGRWVKQKK